MLIGRLAAITGPVCTRRRLKCAAKLLLCVSLVAAYVSVLWRESLQAMETTKQRQSDLRAAAAVVQTKATQQQPQFGWPGRYLSQRRRARNETVAAAIAEAARRAMVRNNRTLAQQEKRRSRHQKQQKAAAAVAASAAAASDVTGIVPESDSKPSTGRSPQPPQTTANPIYEYSAEQNAATQADLQHRLAVLSEACDRHDWVGKRVPNAWEFFLSPGHGLAWCNVFKAASSTWLYYFNILAGIEPAFLQKTKKPPLEMARQHFPRPTRAELEEAMQSSISFLIVREPFERLLSAYRDKLEGMRNKYYKRLGAQIVKRFRKGYKRFGGGPTFKEFVQYVIESHRAGEPVDEHWRAVYEFCTPCSLNYTLIAKVETFRRDTEYIIRQAGLETLLFNKMPAKRMNTISNRSTDDTAGVVAKYYSQLNSDHLRGLLAIYEPDFELFGYNSGKYADLVQSVEKAPVARGLTTTTAAQRGDKTSAHMQLKAA